MHPRRPLFGVYDLHVAGSGRLGRLGLLPVTTARNRNCSAAILLTGAAYQPLEIFAPEIMPMACGRACRCADADSVHVGDLHGAGSRVPAGRRQQARQGWGRGQVAWILPM
jgi:hypothetical protein